MSPGPPGQISQFSSSAGGQGDLANRVTVRVLITSAGNQVALLRCFRDAAAESDLELEIVAVDQRPDDCAACLLADVAHAAPPATDDNYLQRILDLSARHAIDLVIPGSVLETEKLSSGAGRFSRMRTEVVLPGAELTSQLLDFWKWEGAVRDAGARVPRTSRLAAVKARPSDFSWPLIVKAERYGSVPLGTMLLRSSSELHRVKPNAPVILQERPRGQRYVVQLLFDESGNLLCIAPVHLRRHPVHDFEIATTTEEPEIAALAGRLARALPNPRGPIHLHAVLLPDRSLVVEDILPGLTRLYPLIDRAGAKISRWLLNKAANLPAGLPLDHAAGLRMLTYHAPLFLSEA